VKWDENQEDRWLEPNEVLERRIRYRSQREFARRILTVIDGVESIEPVALRAEVEDYLQAYLARPPARSGLDRSDTVL
jgi:predicted DNA-binding transcriptional regulator YafY